MARVAIVDDHQLLADMLLVSLQRDGIAAQVVAPDGTEPLFDRIRALGPRLVLLDLDLGPAGDGVDLVAPLVAEGMTVLLMTGVTDRIRIARALEAGAIGYQPKADGFTALAATARTALTATGPLDPSGRAELLAELAHDRSESTRRFAPFEELTERECAVLRALAQGADVREIAHRWVVSDATVRSHVRGVLTKLGARSQLAAVVAATRSGWLREQN